MTLTRTVLDRTASKYSIVGAPRFLKQYGLSLRSPLCRLLRVVADLWRKGGGDLDVDGLERDYGIAMSEREFEKSFRMMERLGLLEKDDLPDVALGENVTAVYGVSARGIRLATELERLLSRQMSSED